MFYKDVAPLALERSAGFSPLQLAKDRDVSIFTGRLGCGHGKAALKTHAVQTLRAIWRRKTHAAASGVRWLQHRFGERIQREDAKAQEIS